MDKQAISTINDRYATCIKSLRTIIPDRGFANEDAVTYGSCACVLSKKVSSDNHLTMLPLDELTKFLDDALLEAFTIYTHNVSRLTLLSREQEYKAWYAITLIAEELITEFLKSR